MAANTMNTCQDHDICITIVRIGSDARPTGPIPRLGERVRRWRNTKLNLYGKSPQAEIKWSPDPSGVMRKLTSAPILPSTRHSDEETRGTRLEYANPTGKRFNDVLIGVGAPDVVIGLGGSDVLRGMGGNDTLIGVNAFGKNPGRNETDVLYGGIGADTFVLGDLCGGVYYLDKGNKGWGRKSYAGIQDFEEGDKITLRCYEMGEYELDKNYRVGSIIATAIYYNKDDKAGISKADDLIAVVQGSGAASLNLMDNSQFNWIV